MTLKIGDVTIPGRVLAAPMTGVLTISDLHVAIGPRGKA